MASMSSILAMYRELTESWSKRQPPNLDKCEELLGKLKLTLTQVTFLPTQHVSATQQELLLARDILEIGAQWSIAKKDIDSFERYMAQLKCYYLDYKDCLPESAYKHQLLGLNLLRLLAQNKLADFHTELELLPTKDLHQNIYIKHPVSIEQYLMEGSYNKVFLSRNNIPAASYSFFIDILLDTIRGEIAGCIEKAYERLAFVEAKRMLFFESDMSMMEYAKVRKWNACTPDEYFRFHREQKVEDVVPAAELAKQTIEYARELEMIV